MNEEAAVTRQDIYELVWQKPMTRLAEDFGITDQQLARLCEREDIPRPSPGHWSKLAVGKCAGARPPLPAGKQGADAIVFRASAFSAQPTAPNAQVERLKAELPAIPISDRLIQPHPIVAERIASRKKQVRARTEYYDCGSREWEKVAPFNSADRRLLCVLDALCRTLDAHGVAVERNGRGELAVRSGLDAIVFQLRYRMKRVKIPTAPDERRAPLKGPDVMHRNLELTGDLIFEVTSWMPAGFRRKWREGPTYRLEQFASDIVATVIMALPAIAAEREVREERARLYEMRAQQRREQEAQRRLDQNRFRRLAEHADAWRVTSLVRRFVAAVRETDLDMDAVIDGMTVAQWLKWADVAADRHDPLSRSLGVFESIAVVHHRTYSD
ncbi:MAG: hypothetical protein CVT74_11170 [Alphaproteobacteria bacterium HGW-Alphaproteobacteria-13]|jgi:hypothetical protein|nr:MAG: hypothetical protein CVT74_11170 [Alphaproteobacteria bacterium HGW-Alphaproteobacteria-13]